MELTAELIKDILTGKTDLPFALEIYDFTIDLDAVIKKAVSNPLFKKAPLNRIFISNYELEDGQYVSENSLGFKLGDEWVLISDEPGYPKIMLMSPDGQKVIKHYFKDVVDDANSTIVKARIMKSYFHYFKPHHNKNRREHIKLISGEEFQKLSEIFVSVGHQQFSNADELQKFYDELEDGPNFSILKVDNVYTFLVKKDSFNGFHFILAKYENQHILEFSVQFSNPRKGPENNFLEFFQEVTNEPMPHQLQRLIATILSKGSVQ